MRKLALIAALGALSFVASCAGRAGGPKLTAWTTGEPGAPPDVAAVYRAVLDEIFPRGANGPTLIVLDGMTEPGLMETYPGSKRNRTLPRPVIAPFSYRIPITFVDSVGLRDLGENTRKADSIAYTVPMTDLRYRQREHAPFIERYPGAWGRLAFGRVGFGPRLSYAVVEARYRSVAPRGDSGGELFRLARTNNVWKVVERIPRDGPIRAEPIPYGMLHAWVDSSLFPAPKRRLVRGTVKDSASGAALPNFVIRIKAAPLGKQGQLLMDKGPELWGTVFTNSAGEFLISHPPSGYMWVEAMCPPTRGVDGAGLAPAALQPESGLDTVLSFRVRFAACAEFAPLLAQEAERHRQDVARAKVETAARAVQGNIHGTVRDVSTGTPVARVPIRVDRGGVGFSDSLGHFWLWGFAPGKRKISVQCPTRRSFLGGRVATSFTIEAPPRMNDTFDIRIDMQTCKDPDVITVKVRTRGVWSIGFEDGFFTPCASFTQIPLGAYRDWSHQAYLTFSGPGIDPPGGWPDIKPIDGYEKIFLDVEGDLIGPGSYGHLGIATYLLKVTRVVSARVASKSSCVDPGPGLNRS